MGKLKNNNTKMLANLKVLQILEQHQLAHDIKCDMDKKMARVELGIEQYQVQVRREVELSLKRLEQYAVQSFVELAKCMYKDK